MPANIYGKKIKSQAVQLELANFLPVYKGAGETGLVDIAIEGEKAARAVLIHNVQFDPVTDQPIHADFHQVTLTEKVKAEIPVELTGESPAVEQKAGILVRLLDEIEVEALPTDLPEKIEVDLTPLEKVDDMIRISDLEFDKKKISLVGESSRVIVKIEPPAKVEEEKPSVEEEAVEAEEVPEGEAPAEGGAKEEVKPTEEKAPAGKPEKKTDSETAKAEEKNK